MKNPFGTPGNYLCVLHTKEQKFTESYTKYEDDMFCIAKVENGIVSLPGGNKLAGLAVTNTAKALKVSFVEALSHLIQENPDLLKICKQNRVGYTKPENTNPTVVFPRWNQSRMERRFVIKVLKKKGDKKNLAEFRQVLRGDDKLKVKGDVKKPKN